MNLTKKKGVLTLAEPVKPFLQLKSYSRPKGTRTKRFGHDHPQNSTQTLFDEDMVTR